TIDPDGSELIQGASTYVISAGFSGTIVSDGTAWYVFAAAPSEVKDSVFRVTGSSDVTKKLAIEVDGLTTATTRTWTAQDASGTVYITGGTDVAISDGGTGASTAATAFSNLKQDATTSATGVVELLTTAELQTGTDTTRAPTAAAILAAMGFTSYAVSGNTSISSGMSITLTHGFGRIPVKT